MKNYWGIETSGRVCITLQTQSVIAWYEFPIIRLKEVGWVTRVADLFTYLDALLVLSAAQNILHYMVEWLLNSEFERMWMEAVVFWFEELSWYTYSWKVLGKPEEMTGKVATSRARF